MPKVSVNILTKNRAGLLRKALASVAGQTFRDFEIVLISDGSTDNTLEVVQKFIRGGLAINYIFHKQSLGIIAGRSEALGLSSGEYVAILDDDDEWADSEKLAKQVKYLNENLQCVLAGGGILMKNPKSSASGGQNPKFRPQSDEQIRKTMLFRNNFFTSTVMFRKQAAIDAGGFTSDGVDLGEDYDLWLRIGQIGLMYNFSEVFAAYKQKVYERTKFKSFLKKQLTLINLHKAGYPNYWLARALLTCRILL